MKEQFSKPYPDYLLSDLSKPTRVYLIGHNGPASGYISCGGKAALLDKINGLFEQYGLPPDVTDFSLLGCNGGSVRIPTAIDEIPQTFHDDAGAVNRKRSTANQLVRILIPTRPNAEVMAASGYGIIEPHAHDGNKVAPQRTLSDKITKVPEYLSVKIFNSSTITPPSSRESSPDRSRTKKSA